MPITLSNNRKISDYRAKTLLEANDKKEATQLRGVRGWLQSKLSPESGLRSFFGITKREQKLESVWNDLHKPQAKNATTNADKIVTFHNLYNLMDEETKANTEFKVSVTSYGLTKRLNFTIKDKISNISKRITSFKHLLDDKQFIKDNEPLEMSATTRATLLNLTSSYDKSISTLAKLYSITLQLNDEVDSADTLLKALKQKILGNEEDKAYLQNNTVDQITKDFERFSLMVVPPTDPSGKESSLVTNLQVAILQLKLEGII